MYNAVQVSLEGGSKLQKILSTFTSVWWALEKAYPWGVCASGCSTTGELPVHRAAAVGVLRGINPRISCQWEVLIPTGMPTAETPTVSILAGMHWEGNTGAQPRRSGIEKGMRCCSKSPLLANGALTDHAQAMQQLSPPLAHLVWFLAGLTDWCSIHGAAPNVCDPLPGLPVRLWVWMRIFSLKQVILCELDK